MFLLRLGEAREPVKEAAKPETRKRKLEEYGGL
jgi:hypothetical protein